MTACTNKARGAVVAALAGALALGAAPAVALATTGDVNLQFIDNAYSEGMVQLGGNSNLRGEDKDTAYRIEATGEAIKFDVTGVKLADGTIITFDEDSDTVAYFATNDKGEKADQVSEIVDPGTYVIEVTNGEGQTADVKLYVKAAKFSDTDFIPYEVNPNDANDKADRNVIYTGYELNLGIYNTKGLVEGEDYTVKFVKDMTDDIANAPAVDVVEAGTYWAYVEGIGQYAGEHVAVKAVVGKLDLSKVKFSDIDVIGSEKAPTQPTEAVYDETDPYYGGTAINPALFKLSYTGLFDDNKSYTFTAALAEADESTENGVTDSVSVNKIAKEATVKYDGEALKDSYSVNTKDGFDPSKLVAYGDNKQLSSDALVISVADSNGNPVGAFDGKTAGTYTVTLRVDPSKTNYGFGGTWTFTVKATNGTINADAQILVTYKGDNVTSVEKTYDAASISEHDFTVTVLDEDGTPLSGVTATKQIVDSEGKHVGTATDAGSYKLVVTVSGYDLTGTTELPITIKKADLTELTLGSFVDYKGAEYVDSSVDYSNIAALDPQYNTHETDEDGEDVWASVKGSGYEWNTDNVTLERYDTEKGEWVSAAATEIKGTTYGKFRVTIKSTDDLSKNFEFATEDGTTLEFVVADGSKANSWFDDVVPTDVFFNAINWMSTHKAGGAAASGDETALIEGYAGANVFGQGNSITRADVAVILFRMAGGTAGTDVDFKFDENGGYVTGFSDVDGDGVNMYYDQAIAWANATGVVHGYDDGTFGASDFITREQLATMLANYAKVVDRADVELDEDALASMPDGDQVSEYAEKAVSWCVANGLMGNGGSISPLAEITRGETAAMGYNYLTKLVLK